MCLRIFVKVWLHPPTLLPAGPNWIKCCIIPPRRGRNRISGYWMHWWEGCTWEEVQGWKNDHQEWTDLPALVFLLPPQPPPRVTRLGGQLLQVSHQTKSFHKNIARVRNGPVFFVFLCFCVSCFCLFVWISLWSNVWRVWSLKSHCLCQNSKVAVSDSLTHSLTKIRYRADRASKKSM